MFDSTFWHFIVRLESWADLYGEKMFRVGRSPAYPSQCLAIGRGNVLYISLQNAVKYLIKKLKVVDKITVKEEKLKLERPKGKRDN